MYARLASSLNLLYVLSFCLSVTFALKATPESRIVGGSKVNINNAPYLVSLRYKHNSSTPFIHRCSATIYSTNILLTTARCVIGLKPQQLQVVAGTSYRSQSVGYVALVNSIIVHPDFNIWFIDNDLAVLRLEIPLSSSGWYAIESIALPTSTLAEIDSFATVAGWGITAEKGAESEQLQEANVHLISEGECKMAYGEERISKAMLCAGGVSSSGVVIDACRGDAGSALVANGVAVGLVSWGSGCGREGFPGVYTNLAHLKIWIESVVNS